MNTKWFVALLITLASPAAAAAEPSAKLTSAFPAAHIGAVGGLAHFFEYDFGGIGPMGGVAGGVDLAPFFTVEGRVSGLFASVAPMVRIAHGRPGMWGGVYAGPRLMHPISILLPGPGVAGTLGYEFRYKHLRAALDATAGGGWSDLNYQMGELFLHVGWSFHPSTGG